MVIKDIRKYWIKTSDQDWEAANHLFEKGDYLYALFFGHLTIEKILKAIFSEKNEQTPPFSHNLVYLSEKAGLDLNEEQLGLLEEISDFNLEARYPDDKFSFHKKCTIGFTKKKLQQIRMVRKWLLQKLQPSI
jgi:HEPN domain-containing protein